jgi:hypothetical protein
VPIALAIFSTAAPVPILFKRVEEFRPGQPDTVHRRDTHNHRDIEPCVPSAVWRLFHNSTVPTNSVYIDRSIYPEASEGSGDFDYGAKYPFVSITKCEGLVTYAEISALVPAGTMAALAVTCPSGALSVETKGCATPVGHVVR